MSALDYRTWGETRTCKGCRFWSEMLAQSNGASVQAVCLASNSEHSGKFTPEHQSCGAWREGSLGAIDSPGGDPYEVEGEQP